MRHYQVVQKAGYGSPCFGRNNGSARIARLNTELPIEERLFDFGPGLN
jgi:hypothetical protein